MDLRALVREPLRSVAAYDPGPSVSELKARYGLKSLAKLNWNEDLFGLLPGVREAVIGELERAPLYPEQAYSDFRNLVAKRVGATPETILPAHGIQALVLATIATFVNPGERVVLPAPTYGLYRQSSLAAGAEVVAVATRGYRLDLEQMAAASRGAKLVFVCDPNNPTGDALKQAEWAEFIEALPEGCIAVVDEAYGDYIAAAQRPRRIVDVSAGRPVVMLRTFSKLFGIAGLRLGFAIVSQELIPAMDAVQEPFNVNRLALAAGMACLADPRAVEERRVEVAAARDAFAAALTEIGISNWQSQANFVLANPGGDDQLWFEGLLRNTERKRQGALARGGLHRSWIGHGRR